MDPTGPQRPERYPWRQEYCAFPGPNSNTYTAWVLHEADIHFDFPPSSTPDRWPVARVAGASVGH